jgi:hypothetical protein
MSFSTHHQIQSSSYLTSFFNYIKINLKYQEGKIEKVDRHDRRIILDERLTMDIFAALPPTSGILQQGISIIVRRGNYQARYTLQGQQLIDERGRTWYKVKLPAAQRIDGVYARADFRDADVPRLILRADGDTMLTRLNEFDYKKLLRSGSGTYSFENFTLTLYAQDGRLWQINTFVPPNESFPKVRHMVVNGYKLQRD